MTRIRKHTGSSLPIVGLLALGLVACGGQSEEASRSGTAAKVAVTQNGVTVDVLATQSWSGGFNGAVRITDTSFASPITSFKIVFKLNGGSVVGSGWNGTITGPDASGNYTASSPDWLQYGPIRAGTTWDVGFNGSGTLSSSTIVSITINGGNNQVDNPPSVSLASSATTVTVGGSYTLTATATDDKGITKVEFYDGGNLVATDTSAPYTFAVTSAVAGSHVYTAKAYDNATPTNQVTTSAAVTVTVGTVIDNPPTVSLASSATSVNAGGSYTLTATATDDKGITKVEFYDGATLVATDTSAPYTFAVTSAVAGTHVYTAKAYDNATPTNQVTTSASVTVTVGTVIDNPPTVTLASSATTVTVGGSYTLTATATDDKGITKVEFYDGATLVATDTTSPYTFAVTSAVAGSHVYTAKAYDNATPTNQVTTSTAVTVTVGTVDNPPTVTLAASPTSLTAAGTVTLTATATDDHGITKVEFYDGATLLGTDTTAPYTQGVSYTTSAQNGIHSMTAKAYDNATPTAHVTTSVAVSVNVNIGGQSNVFRVNSAGRITRNGAQMQFKCGSWFGLQGRYEPASDPTNPRGAPMELYMGNTFWANGGAGTGRTVAGDLAEIKAAGINVVRFPVVHQTLDATDPQGMAPNLKNFSSVRVANSRLALEQFLKAADAAGVYVMLDIHSCSNYVDWRKGRLDARPPWVDATRNDYDYKREDCSCAPDNNPPGVTRIQAYNETIWLQDLKTLAGFETSLGVHNIIGIDIFNEPWDYSWLEWKKLIEDAYTAINSVNPNILVFAQGISASHGNQLGVGAPPPVATPYGTVNPNWGENLFEAGANPPAIPKDRLVFSPHTYGPSVAVQPQFMDPTQSQCTGLEGDAAGDAKCNIVINPTLLKQGWEDHFGYLKQLGFAVMVGEFGGNMEWPKGKASTRDQTRYSYLTSTNTDELWQNALVDYMVSKGIEGCYWSINPESGDTGGWYSTPYDPITNTGGWGEWGAFQPKKTTLLNRLWSGIP